MTRPAVVLTAAVLLADVPIAALAPVVLLLVAFVAYCEIDILRAESVRFLPKWAWALVCLASVPLGGCVYLALGRDVR